MKITPKFNFVPVSFDTNELGMLCLTSAIHGNVEMRIYQKDCVLNLPVAIITQHSRDFYVDCKFTKEDATKLGNEIARRWNEFQRWRPATDEQYPTDKEVLCRMKSNGAIVSGFIYKENGVYKVATSSDFHFEDYGDYECDLYMLIPEITKKTERRNEMSLLINETQLQRIIRKTGRKPVQCKCRLCKQQCHTPCLGTPQDILKLIEAGYKDRLAATEWLVGIIMGVTDMSVPMIQAKQEGDWCTFYKDGLCELHDAGLKPTEGRLSHHSIRLDNFKPSKSIAWNVAKEWLNEENVDCIEKICEAMAADNETQLT